MSRLTTLSVLLCVLHASTQRSTPADDHYVAAVVEYQVSNDVSANLQNYANLIKDASGQNADIIVFPELTLSRGRSVVVPIHGILKDYPVPALRPDLYDEVLVTISSAARQNAIYVVINIEELVDCTHDNSEYCPEPERYLFNTNVVFDRTGAVIDRYRKINLFGEYTRMPALQPDLGVFSTDFGVKFGHFVCFDLMFQVPAVQLVDKYNLTDIIFPTMWFSEMPYLTAVQIQEAYAYSMNVNFLGAGANNVRVGSAGSGIYSGKAGALVSTMPGVPTTRLLVAKVPKVPGKVSGTYPGPIYDDPSTQDDLVLISDPSLPSHITRTLTPGFQEITLTDKDVTCHFKVRLNKRNTDTYYRYRAAAFSGVRSFSGVATGGSRLCSVVACTNDTIQSCGHRFPKYVENATSVFEELEIIAEVPKPIIDEAVETTDSAYFPVSLDTAIMPLEISEYTFEEKHTSTINIYEYKLKNFDTGLYAFGIWGRVYETDGEDATPAVDETNNGIVVRIRIVLLLLSLFVGFNI
ncbi:vanin-like protein 1 isoform X1 [Aricia agestis]|uniref:vanin-like protein 1 isoform X1 n=1 Tax=Aricia agestis TaxID=91739 RepID=UPI001C204A55|nr:vanin-like protein 1 isoform X1 [Aricia agestis]